MSITYLKKLYNFHVQEEEQNYACTNQLLKDVFRVLLTGIHLYMLYFRLKIKLLFYSLL